MTALIPAATVPLVLSKRQRRFVPDSITGDAWPPIETLYHDLLARQLDSIADFAQWLTDTDELRRVLQEELGWRYIRMTCDTREQKEVAAYRFFIEEISPQIAPLENALNQRFYACPHRTTFEAQGVAERLLSRRIAAAIEIFRAENVSLQSQVDVKAQQYGALSSNQTIEHDGKSITLQQAAVYLERTERTEREAVWLKVAQRRHKDRATLDTLYDELIALRAEMAANAGFESYTDYRFAELARFDYGRKECVAFHDAIAEAITPLYTEINEVRRRRLGLDRLRPWDLAVDPFGDVPLHPFASDTELVDRSITLFGQIRPELGQMVATLRSMGHLDLSSRPGKAPGGYNYPLLETGVPFIFMNAVGTQSDLTTMVHEVGHAIHSFVTRDLAFAAYQDCPSEVAELASMSSELITLDHWGLFYPQGDNLRRAQLNQILRTLTLLPWIATVDAFQTWVYDHPRHTHVERSHQWKKLHQRFFGPSVDWSGHEGEHAYQWHRQLHIFELPFYYIEYGIAQLGALQVWRNVQSNPTTGIEQYLEALRLGYTRPIPEIYAVAGARFDFSAAMLAEVLSFVRGQLKRLGFFDA